MAVRAVTIDAAGTLIVPHPSVGLVYAQVAARHGITADATALESAFFVAFSTVRAKWPVPYGADESDARAFWAQVVLGCFAAAAAQVPAAAPLLAQELFDEFALASRWRVLPGAHQAVALIRQRGLRLAVLSNFDLRLPPLLAALNLGPWDAVICSSKLGIAKPDPRCWQAAAATLGVEPTHLLHLGDSQREDGGCQTLGIPLLLVNPAIGIDLAALTRALDQP